MKNLVLKLVAGFGLGIVMAVVLDKIEEMTFSNLK
ncbi:hypothetical protein UFVDC4_00190 [Staphylococcus phage vB_SauM-UFV_DC4]|nr:hypothetical protein UFVDC4_00190 [Staphylococcus phage vB_SauM-UFV_DC4]